MVSTRSGKPHAEYKETEKLNSLEKEKEAPSKESPTKDKEAPIEWSSKIGKENEVLTTP